MIVDAFIETLYHGLTQRGATMFVSKESIMNFINFGLNDIYSFEGRGWSFMYQPNEEIIIPVLPEEFYTEGDLQILANTSYLHTTTYPLFRLVNIYDKKMHTFITSPRFKQNSLDIKNEGEIFFTPFTTALSIYNNNSQGYKLAYLGWFNNITKGTDTIPVPNSFIHALYDFVMSYILPVYAQYGETRENVEYQKGMSKLNELKKADDVQFTRITFNIK